MLKTVWQRLTEPAYTLKNPTQRRQARWLSAMLLALIFVGAIILSIWIAITPDFAVPFLLTVVTLTGQGMAYFLSRTRFYYWAALVLIATLIFMVAGVMAFAPGSYTDRIPAIYFLALPVLLASLLLSMRITALLAILSVIATASLFVLPDVPTERAYSTTVFMVSIAVLILVSALLRQQDTEKIDRQNRELALLERITNSVALELDVNKLFRTLVETVADAFGYTQVSAYRVREGVLYLQHQIGYQDTLDEIPISKGVMGRVARTGEAAFLPDVSTDPDFIPAIEGIRSEVCVPLFDQDQLIGVLNVESVQGITLTERDLHVMMALSTQVSLAIARGDLYSRVHSSEKRFRALIENSTDALVLLSADQQIIYYSTTLSRILGYTSDELLGSGALRFIHVEDLPRAAQVLSKVAKNFRARANLEFRFQHKDGYYIWLDGTAHNLLDDPNVQAIVVNYRDISERKRAEKQAAELGHRSEQMRMMADFIQNFSHDFRTPLSTLNNNLYLLKHVETEDKRERYIGIMEKQIERLATLIEELLVMTRLDSEVTLNRYPTNLNTLIHDLVTRMQVAANEKSLQINLDLASELPIARIDEIEMGRALRELVQNAFHYTPNGGTVTLRTTHTTPWIVIEVIDTGCGISQEDIPHIFERFYRADRARSTETGGVGLGLTIARKIVQLHRGKIEVESHLDQGSTFRVYLPL